MILAIVIVLVVLLVLAGAGGYYYKKSEPESLVDILKTNSNVTFKAKESTGITEIKFNSIKDNLTAVITIKTEGATMTIPQLNWKTDTKNVMEFTNYVMAPGNSSYVAGVKYLSGDLKVTKVDKNITIELIRDGKTLTTNTFSLN